MKIYATPGQAAFARKMALKLEAQVASAKVGSYPDGQTFVELNDLPVNEDAVVVGGTLGPVEFEAFRLLLHTVKRQNVRQVIAVIPYFGAGRQDRAKADGQDVFAKLQAEEISARRPDWVLLMDLHNGGILNFFDDGVRARELYAESVFITQMRALELVNFVCVSPDAGRFNWAQSYAKKLGVEAASLDKRREGPGKSSVFHVVGDVCGKDVILIDDIIDSGGTVISGAEALKAAGAKDIHLFATHLVLSGDSAKKFYTPKNFRTLHGTDTISYRNSRHDFITHSVADEFAKYIKNIVNR